MLMDLLMENYDKYILQIYNSCTTSKTKIQVFSMKSFLNIYFMIHNYN